jgi:Type ISP C-terminal specificity domain
MAARAKQFSPLEASPPVSGRGLSSPLAVKTGKSDQPKLVRFRDDINAAKAEDRRRELVESLDLEHFDEKYETAHPQPYNWLSLKPLEIKSRYLEWPKVSELAAAEPDNGLMEKRGGALINIDRAAIVQRAQAYFDLKTPWEAYKLVGGQLAKNRARFDAERTRKKVISKETFQDSRVLRYLARPFDLGYCYYSPIRPLWNEPRPGLWADYQIPGNWFVLTQRVRGGEPEGTPFLFTRLIGDDHALRTDAYFFPIRVTTDHGALMGKSVGVNLSGVAREYLAALGLPDPDTDDASAEAIWLHTLAIGFSPEYRRENKDGIAVDWPRIPLPRDCERLQASIALGRRIVELLDTERSVPGITSGSIDAHLRPMGPISATDLRVTAGWGRLDSEGRVSPGQGRYERRKWTDAECALLREGFGKAGLDDSRALPDLNSALEKVE